jgi:ribosomal protein L22
MASRNTEKPTGKAEQKKQQEGLEKNSKKKKEQLKVPVKEFKKEESKEQIEKKDKIQETTLETTNEKDKKEIKKEKVETKKVKKEEVKVVGKDLPASTKVVVAICKFIKNKSIEKSIKDLQEVQKLKKAVPMKGEIPHRKGKIMSGRFPKKVASQVERLLKSLEGNANQHNVEEPIITKAIANIASRPLGKKGRISKKRSHLIIWATEKSRIKMIKENKNKKEKVKKK